MEIFQRRKTLTVKAAGHSAPARCFSVEDGVTLTDAAMESHSNASEGAGVCMCIRVCECLSVGRGGVLSLDRDKKKHIKRKEETYQVHAE